MEDIVYKSLRSLNNPAKIQDLLNSLPFNFEEGGETYRSVRESLIVGKAHCFEGALIACAALWLNGEKPLLMDLRTVHNDDDHVVALFKRGGLWGALSKTNHGVLRYREPVYKSPRELAMSYFHEYFDNKTGEKTLREHSLPFDLTKTKIDWMFAKEPLDALVRELDNSPHQSLVPKGLRLRKADMVEIQAGRIVEYKRI